MTYILYTLCEFAYFIYIFKVNYGYLPKDIVLRINIFVLTLAPQDAPTIRDIQAISKVKDM